MVPGYSWFNQQTGRARFHNDRSPAALRRRRIARPKSPHALALASTTPCCEDRRLLIPFRRGDVIVSSTFEELLNIRRSQESR